ncbi:uncharacterized protein G2W53_009386 [Senna tora]|uniref:Uncharacterized protein n=1 Tax=Senna tora TaxID=362788 RepID=A0A835CCE0_9FABA|nr:uncharacterized protein G2W53_009386 [Senna tora]
MVLRGNPFYYSIAANKPKTIAKLLEKVEKLVNKEKPYFVKKWQKFPKDEKENSKKRMDDSQRGEDKKKER